MVASFSKFYGKIWVCFSLNTAKRFHCVKIVQIWSFSRQYFPTFGRHTEIYRVNLRIQSKCGKIRTRKSSVFGPFSRFMNYNKTPMNSQKQEKQSIPLIK